MVKRHVELSFLLEMAGVAKLRLGLNKQKLRLFRVVRRMAGDATDVILQMNGVDGVHVLRAAGMAVQATSADLLRRCALKSENLGLVSSAVDVGLPRTVATFAALPCRAFLRIQSGYKVRRILKMLEEILGWHVCMARFTRLRSNIQRWIARADVCLRLIGRLGLVFSRIGTGRASVNSQCGTARNKQNKEEQMSGAADTYPLPEASDGKTIQ